MDRDTIARIIDANFNRAREALRVVEDFARFAQDRADLAERTKRIRHELREAWERLPGERLLAARDTPGDVGTEITTPSESQRGCLQDVAAAACKRAGEALRTLEEYGKLIDPVVAGAFKQMRYSVYEIEPRLLIEQRRRARLSDARLHVLITESLCRLPWLSCAEQVLAGGAKLIQLREKNMDDGELVRRARMLRTLTAAHDALLIINDRPDIAILCDADGVHVGQGDLSVVDVRRIVGPDRLIGLSTHDLPQFRAAMEQRIDYVAVGPMFTTTTKSIDQIAGPPFLSAASELCPAELPLVAIGGINTENVAMLQRQAACHVAVCGSVIGSSQPAAAVDALLGAML